MSAVPVAATGQSKPKWQDYTLRHSFHTAASVADADPWKHTRHRKTLPPLVWAMLAHAMSDDPDFFQQPEDGEFEVIDMAEKEKAWFEWPAGLTADRVTGWVSGWFGASAIQTGPRTWVV